MESEVNKAKNITEEEFRSCYPQISIQPKIAVKSSTPAKSTPVKSPAVVQKAVAKAAPVPVKAGNVTNTVKQNVAAVQVPGKVTLPVTTKRMSVTTTLLPAKTPPANAKSQVATRGQVPATPGTVKQPAVTRTPVAVKSPQVVAKSPARAVNKPVLPVTPAVNKPQQGVMKVQAVPQVKQSPVLKQLTLQVKSPQVPDLLKTQANVAKPLINTTPKVAQKVGVQSVTGKKAIPNQPVSNLKATPKLLPQATNQLSVEKVEQRLTQPMVLSSNNQVVLQPVVTGAMVVQTKNIPTGSAFQGKIVVGNAQSTSQATPLEPLQALQVSKQVTLFGPKGNTLNMEDFKKEQILKQSAMTNVVSSTTNPTPAPTPVPAPTPAEQKKTQPPQRNLTSSQSPVRQSPRGTQKAKAVPAKQYPSTLGQVKRVSPRREMLPQNLSPIPQDMQLANEEEVTTSEIEETPENPGINIIVILPSGETKNLAVPDASCLNSYTVQDLLKRYDVGDGRDNVDIVTYTGEGSETENIGDQWNIADKFEDESNRILGLEPGEIPNLSEIEKEEGNEDELKDDITDTGHHDGLLAVCKFCGYTSEDFNFCQRCKKKLPENCKTVPANESLGHAEPVNQKSRKTKADSLTGGSPKKKKVCRKRRLNEPVCLTISDEESELLGLAQNNEMSDENCHSDSSQMFSSDKEPVITDEMMKELNLAKSGVDVMDKELEELLDNAAPEDQTFLQCRTVRIGSYKVVPKDRVMITPHGIKVTVPVLNSDQYVDIKILFNEIIKVLIHFGRQLPVLFFYTKPIADLRIRRLLNMEDRKGYYYDTTSSDETHRRITLLPDKMDEACKQTLKNIFSSDPSQRIFAELMGKEANDILVKTSPKEVQEFIKKKQPNKNKLPPPPPPPQNFNGQDIHTIMVYPPPPEKGGIPINTEDYACLDEDQFLNDVIIDFYLKYVVEKTLEPADRARTHVFSSFFYNRLTTKPGRRKSMNPTESDPTASPAVKRHSRVKSWTKNVDLFTKDFVVIPINENSHWFLAIVCFPGLTGPVRFSDNTPIDLPGRKKKNSSAGVNNTAMGTLSNKQVVTIGSTTITAVGASTVDVQDEGDRDEADGEDEKMDVPDEDEEQKAAPEVKEELEEEQVPMTTRSKKQPREPIKQPCILIFDSLAGASRARVVATLRDYLKIEYETKHSDARDFSGEVLKGTNVKCPQQTNYTDCGLYVLQYVEAFFQTPITDYHIPILQVQNWFMPAVVSRKRYEIQQLLHRLMEEQNLDLNTLNLPVLNLRPESKLVDYEDEEEQMCDDEDDEMLDDGEYPDDMEHEENELGEMEEGDIEDMGDGDMEDEMDDGEMEDGVYEDDEEDGHYLDEEDLDHDDDLNDEYLGDMDEDGEVMHEEFSVNEENHSLRPSSTGKSEGLKHYRIPRLTKKDNVNNDDL